MCNTMSYFLGYLSLAMPDTCILGVSITNIDWTYADDCPTAPVTVTFAVQATLCDGSVISAEDLYHNLVLDNAAIQKYLEEYVWKSDPLYENLFYHANQLTLEGHLGSTIRPGKISAPSC